MIRGSVDIISATEVHGWAYGPAHQEPVLVQAVLNHQILGEAPASIHRPDLAAAGLGSGRSGYIIKLRRPIDPLYLPFLTVKVDGGDAELPRAPMLGFAEFFSALYIAHPGAGRSRSVFGGLWTDRTDAAALLRGKSACGQISAPAAAILIQLIQTGFALLALAAVPAQADWLADLTAQILVFLQADELLNPLRAILEDNPLVIESTWTAGDEAAFAQPSAKNPSPSPAECVEIIVAFGNGVVLEVVRDSFKLPEFTTHGVSRWRHAGATAAVAEGFLDRYDLAAGHAAIVGPGTIFRLISPPNDAARFLVIPARGMPAKLAMDGKNVERVLEVS